MAMTFEAEIHTLAVPYALHALDEAEALRFEEHLAVCESCLAEVTEARETAARLGEAESVPAPAALKTRVLDEIRQVRPLPPEPVREDTPVARPGWRWFPRLATALAAASAVVAVALGVELYDTRSELSAAQSHAAELGDMLAAADVEIVAASDEEEMDGMAVLSREQDAAMVMMKGTDGAPAGQVYQVWLTGDSGARPAGFMKSMDTGGMMISAHGLGDASRLDVTMEPEGGSDQPTSAPVMTIDL